MSNVVIGKSGRENVGIDLNVLLRTRLLVQANSGGGKSWLLRRLAEQMFGKIPVIIIDLEGEFATLREKFGYVLVGKGGETPADVRSAALVARRLLELRASAVCDLYELKPSQRHAWVRGFLESIMDAPKQLWRPTAIIVDEAHTLAPEKGAGESEASEAIIHLATAGRKRGFACILATQRLGKLRKDAAAELLNILVGMTFIDIDRKRAAEALGVPRSDERTFFDEIKVLEPGHFYALGRAISKERVMVKVGDVSTTHPEAGSAKHGAEPPPPPEKIKALLPKLSDLPKIAEAKAKTEDELRGEIRSLRAQLAAQQQQRPQIQARSTERLVEVPILGKRDSQRLAKLVNGTSQAAAMFGQLGEQCRVGGGALVEAARRLTEFLNAVEKIKAGKQAVAPQIWRPKPVDAKLADPRPTIVKHHDKRQIHDGPTESSVQLKAGERRMLQVLAQRHPIKMTKAQLGTLAGFTPSGGTYSNYFSVLRRGGFISEQNGEVEATQACFDYLGSDIPKAPQTVEELQRMWRSHLKAGEGKMLDVLIEAYPNAMSREELGERTGFTASGGTFGNYLGVLRRNGLIEVKDDQVRASDTLFSVEKP